MNTEKRLQAPVGRAPREVLREVTTRLAGGKVTKIRDSKLYSAISVTLGEPQNFRFPDLEKLLEVTLIPPPVCLPIHPFLIHSS